jgi:hypothetical protein
MKFTVRMFASTQDGYQFIHKVVELPEGIWKQMMEWACSNRESLMEVKASEDGRQESLWGPIYRSYGEWSQSLPKELGQKPDVQAAIAHFFNLAMDNPEMLPTEFLGRCGEQLRAGQDSAQALEV